MVKNSDKITAQECTKCIDGVSDAFYVIGGKWKLRIIIALSEGNKRFNELQRAVTGISARVLSNELKDLEMNGFLTRKVYADATPVMVEYQRTEYAESLHDVLHAMTEWGIAHRARLRQQAMKMTEPETQKETVSNQ